MEASGSERRPTRQPRPTVEQARAFVAVADTASYREAAERLELTEHVTLIRLVSRFTKTLGLGRLIETEAKDRVSLTATGERVLPAARAFIESARELTELHPEIRFSAYPTIAGQLARRCSELLEQKVPLVLKNVSEANRQDGGWRLVHDVASRRLDMAIAPAHLQEERLDERLLYSWRLRVIFPEAQKLSRRRSVTPEDIAGFRIAVAPQGHKSRDLLSRAFEMADVGLRVALESPNQELLRSVAQGGTQYAAVIPDDAFGFEETKDAPVLCVRGKQESFGGKYALYMRKSVKGESSSELDKAIADAADKLVDAFRETPRRSRTSR